MNAWLYALIAHGVLAALDVVVNHEIVCRLPRQPELWLEVRLHSFRELVFAVVFGCLAWFEPHGLWSFVLIALVFSEILLSVVDTVLELDVRVLPRSERVLHVLLFINLGVIVALLSGDVGRWMTQPTALVPAGYGILSWILTLQAIGALGWAIRDGISQRRLKRRHRGDRDADGEADSTSDQNA